MAFNPQSIISLCTVSFDSSQKHQIIFRDEEDRDAYFKSKVVKQFTEYLTVRKTLPDGSSESSVKVEAPYDELQTINYMFYKNSNRTFYAFITKIIYINEDTTELRFETDVFQTWFFDVAFLDSFVVREHTKSDLLGEHLKPENFSIEEYKYDYLAESDFPSWDSWGYLLGTTDTIAYNSSGEPVKSVPLRGRLQTGVYQSINFHFFDKPSEVNDFLLDLEKVYSDDTVMFLCAVPKFCVEEGLKEDDTVNKFFVYGTPTPPEHNIKINIRDYLNDFDGYTPKNKKLFSNQFVKLVCSNHQGSTAEFSIEDFEEFGENAVTDEAVKFYPVTVKFVVNGDLSSSPSISCYPMDYKGVNFNLDEGISIREFTQCSYNSDTFKLWYAKNKIPMENQIDSAEMKYYTAMLNGTVGTGANLFGLNFGGSVSTFTNSLISSAEAVRQRENTLNTINVMSKAPHKTSGGSPQNNLLTGLGYNCFSFYIQKIKKHHAKAVDDFFTMYGYKINEVKKPNLNSRPYFNYVQTKGLNVTRKMYSKFVGVPDTDLRLFKEIFDNGVTLWQPTAQMFVYDVDNSPTK